jgi:hypothetical protein
MCLDSRVIVIQAFLASGSMANYRLENPSIESSTLPLTLQVRGSFPGKMVVSFPSLGKVLGRLCSFLELKRPIDFCGGGSYSVDPASQASQAIEGFQASSLRSSFDTKKLAILAQHGWLFMTILASLLTNPSSLRPVAIMFMLAIVSWHPGVCALRSTHR